MSSTDTSTNSSSAEPSLPELRAAATSLLYSGRRLLRHGDYHNAAAELAASCEHFAKVFGESAEECGEAYLEYGKALAEVSRVENEVLTHAMEDVSLEQAAATDNQVEDPEKVTEEEKANVQKTVAEALKENFDRHHNIAKHHFVDYEEEQTEESENSKNSMETDAAPETSEEAEETTNLQLAWEMLELAKAIFTKKAKVCEGEKRVEVEARRLEAAMWLGEVSLEGGQHALAMEDFAACLQARQATLPKDSRSIAESHYAMGRAQAALGKFAEAETSLNSAAAVLEDRRANLAKMEPSAHISEEMEDLEELIDDVKEVMVEHKNMAFTEVETLKRKLSSSSPSGKVVEVAKAPRLDTAKAIGSSGPGTA